MQCEFVSGLDDKRLFCLLKKEIARLHDKRLDDLVGRATVENVAVYLLSRLHSSGVDFISVKAGCVRAKISASEIHIENINAEIEYKKGVSHLIRGNVTDAYKALAAAMEIDSTDARYPNALGRCLRQMGRIPESVMEYERAISLDPKFGEPFRNRGNAFLEMGRYEEALTDFTTAINLMPESPLAYKNRGYTYFLAGNFQDALTDHDQAIKLDRNYEEAFRDRAEVLTKLGRIDEVMRDRKEAERHKGKRNDKDIERTKLLFHRDTEKILPVF